jgi:hypothetical protein
MLYASQTIRSDSEETDNLSCDVPGHLTILSLADLAPSASFGRSLLFIRASLRDQRSTDLCIKGRESLGDFATLLSEWASLTLLSLRFRTRYWNCVAAQGVRAAPMPRFRNKEVRDVASSPSIQIALHIRYNGPIV